MKKLLLLTCIITTTISHASSTKDSWRLIVAQQPHSFTGKCEIHSPELAKISSDNSGEGVTITNRKMEPYGSDFYIMTDIPNASKKTPQVKQSHYKKRTLSEKKQLETGWNRSTKIAKAKQLYRPYTQKNKKPSQRDRLLKELNAAQTLEEIEVIEKKVKCLPVKTTEKAKSKPRWR